jgi:hypothetical protein
MKKSSWYNQNIIINFLVKDYGKRKIKIRIHLVGWL